MSLNVSNEDTDVNNSVGLGIELGTLDKKNRFQVNKVGDKNGINSEQNKNGGGGVNKDVEAGVADEDDIFPEDSETTKIISNPNRFVATKSSFRDVDKPSRFRDVHAATRFQVTSDHDRETESEDDDANLLGGAATDTAASYDTKYGKSFRHFTREALPRLDNYRNIMSIQAAYRPTLDELHNATLSNKSPNTPSSKPGETADVGSVKFGWIMGVLMRCLLNIWGVMLFLRLSWVVAQAGIGEALLLIMTTTCVTSITALSMSAISTNGVIKGGGTYYMISRSLGPEFGGSIGLIFSMANAVACAMYVVGFCESMRDLLHSFGAQIVDGDIQDVRIIGSITIIILTVIVVVGMEWEAKAQVGLLVILLVAIADFMIGTVIGPKNDQELVKGFLGYNATLFKENFFSDYREHEGKSNNFFSVFAIFFPAATGILAGANISGDLKDPQKSIPKGTLLAIFITTLSYLIMAIMTGGSVAREATGHLGDLADYAFLNCTNSSSPCEYGLHHSFQVIELVSAFGPLIYAGCFAATLSSALASLVSAPKVFQALCKDELYPYITWFARGYGKNNEPVRGYVLTFFIAIAFILIGDLNTIAPLISNFFLAAYTLINFSTFHASLAKPIGWRPTFRYYNMWLSLAGSILCVAVMFLISWWMALLTLAVVLALYLIVSYRKPDVNWGSTTQAQTYKNALLSIQQLNNVEEHVKNYRPQILVLSGLPGTRPPLIDFAYLLTKNLSLLVCGHILKGPVTQRIRNALNNKAGSWLRNHKIKAFYNQVDETNFELGAKALLQASGIGKLKPNILLLGYKNDWNKCPKEDLEMYFDVMHKALDMYMAVAILRLQDGLDYSKVLGNSADGFSTTPGNQSSADLNALAKAMENSGGRTPIRHASSESVKNYSQQVSQAADLCNYLNTGSHHAANIQTESKDNDDKADLFELRKMMAFDSEYKELIEESPLYGPDDNKTSSVSDLSTPATPNMPRNAVSASPDPEQAARGNKAPGLTKKERKREEENYQYQGPNGEELPKDVVARLTQFSKKQRNGTIDVWWLYDDGGLTLLLPYIISTRRTWSNCRLRVFALANKQAELEFEQRSMASLLAKFRIDYSDLLLLPDITKKPSESTSNFFDQLIANFVLPENKDDPDSAQIPSGDLIAMKDKTNRHLRLRELLLEHSMQSNLIVMTLPMPRKNIMTAPLYMAWLEVLTRDMPPFLLVRGNQTSVLTFYS